MKRTELQRKTPLKRVGQPRRTKPLVHESAKKRAGRGERAEIRRQVFERDGYRCQLTAPHACAFSHLTFHHLLKASAGGEYSLDNGLTLCVVANDWVEDNPDQATRLGLVRRGKEAT
jgi:5-methylcytosine-specific restriction endonuclease McrA